MPTCTDQRTRAPSKTYRFERGPFVDVFVVDSSYVEMIDRCAGREHRDLLHMAAPGAYADAPHSWWVTHTVETKDQPQ